MFSEPDFASVTRRALSPTDVAAWVRLNRCERFLRLQMHEHSVGQGFLHEAGTTPQNAASVLTRAGAAFEADVETRLRALFPSEHWGEGGGAKRPADNARFLSRARSLHLGERLLLCQPRLEATLGDWLVRGDADLLLLTGTPQGVAILITDIKATAHARVEHRLQAAFYHAIVNRLLSEGDVSIAGVETAILFRGPADGGAEWDRERDAARVRLRLDAALLEVVSDADAYLHEVESLVSGPHSDAARIAALPFDSLSFAFGTHCDACRYAAWCWKDAAEKGDLSLVPFLPARDKRALRAAGIDTVERLAALKEADGKTLHTPPDNEDTVRALASSVGASLDEWVWRARRTKRVTTQGGDPPPRTLPGAGHSTLPHCSAEHNPNLVTVYIDLQHDPLHGRVWAAGSLVVAHENGAAVRRRASVHLSDGPPETAAKEGDMFGAWMADTLAAVLELAAPDAWGERKAPVHLVFWSDGQQGALLDALARNFHVMLGAAPALYDFVTQMAAFDSPVATFLDGEMRARKNYPMLAQSLYAVSWFLRFPWDGWRKIFKERIFDAWQRTDTEDGAGAWMEIRARHSSAVPPEYAYAAWNVLPPSPKGKEDPFRAFRHVTLADLTGFAEARLHAMEKVAADIGGNSLTEKTTFELPDLATFTERAASLAGALEEFVTIERHTDLAAWKAGRQIAAPRRALSGTALLVRYWEEDQALEVAERNRNNIQRAALQEEQRAAFKLANPNAKQVRLPPEQKAQSDWSMDGLEFRLRIETDSTDADVETLLGLSTLRDGDRCVLFPRTTVDSRLPIDQQTPNQPTPKQMLYGPRITLVRIERANGQAFAVVEAVAQAGGTSKHGYTFGSTPKPLLPDEAYTLDPDPNDNYGLQQRKVVEELCDAEAGTAPANALYTYLKALTKTPPQDKKGERDLSYTPPVSGGDGGGLPYFTDWPDTARDGQARFLQGLDALRHAGAFHDWEDSKRDYIGLHGDDPVLLVQGPPGTGKSYSTAFAVLARAQGALCARKEFRALVSCKTHSATDVLLHAVRDAMVQLSALRERFPQLWSQYFHTHLLDIPLLRVNPKTPPPDGIVPLRKDDKPSALDTIKSHPACIVGATPGGVYSLVNGKKPMHGRPLCDLLVLDEASQMGLPEACMAALVLKEGAQTIVVGDPRQMPPIVKHAWEQEPRRTFQEYRAFRSLFETLGDTGVPTIKFAESFRLHPVMAEFLRDAVYRKDGIAYHSNKARVLPTHAHADAFVTAALSPLHPLTVIVHDETASQTRNLHEQELIGPILKALASETGHNLNAKHGFGVVVPHRAQKAALRRAFPSLTWTDPDTGETLAEAVDTVERYQGEERDVVIVSATESDRDYLQQSAAFLLDPRRLTVALSRAKTKLILVASRSVFGFFSTDEELFQSSLLWKNLLRRACPVLLWEGRRDGQNVQIWGSPPPK